MFGLARRTQTAVEELFTAPLPAPAPPRLRLVRPTPRLTAPPTPETTVDAYAALAAEIGFAPARLVKAQLQRHFHTQGIALYDYDTVEDWLFAKAQEAGAKTWCWRPLRPADIITAFVFGMQNAKGGYYTSDKWECRPYGLLVPAFALQRVADVQKAFGDQVKFFVSDYVSDDPDPFLMVRPATTDSGCLIFAMWDEPGFGEPQKQ